MCLYMCYVCVGLCTFVLTCMCVVSCCCLHCVLLKFDVCLLLCIVVVVVVVVGWGKFMILHHFTVLLN